jgi:hypothetical protein
MQNLFWDALLLLLHHKIEKKSERLEHMLANGHFLNN